MKKKDERLMNKTEMIMLRSIRGISLRENIRNQEGGNSSDDNNTPDAEVTLPRWYYSTIQYDTIQYTPSSLSGFIQHSCHKIQGLFKVLLFFSRLNRIGKTLNLLRNVCRSKHTFIGWRIM